MLEVLQSVEQDYDPFWGSLFKQAIRRVYPGFNEGYYGYGSFSELLEDIKSQGADRAGIRQKPGQLQGSAAEELSLLAFRPSGSSSQLRDASKVTKSRCELRQGKDWRLVFPSRKSKNSEWFSAAIDAWFGMSK